jgi:putative thioredoxin
MDVSDADFATEVLERSRHIPVVVDFWAPWCGPCLALGPVLEREVAALGDRALLVKVNTDESPEAAQRYAIASIPAVKAFRDGAVVAEFVGARDAAFVRRWLASLGPTPAQLSLAAALAAGDAAALRALADDADVGPQATRALARLEFRADAEAFGGEERARAALARNPEDLEARWALAGALAARGAVTPALDELLEIVRRSRRFKGDAARKAVIALLDELDGDQAREYRKRLMILT